MKNNKFAHCRNILPTLSMSLLLASQANAADLALSNHSYYEARIFTTHTVGASFSDWHYNPPALPPYMSITANSSYLNLYTYSSLDASHIDQLGYDYVTAEASTNFEADLLISGAEGVAFLSMDVLYDETASGSPAARIYGEQSIRILDDTNNLVFAYLQANGSPDELKNIALNYGTTYRLQLWSTAYTYAQAFTTVSNQRSFSVGLSVSDVPAPATAWLLGSALLGLAGLARTRKTQ